jgi:hypothetical protein
VDFWPSGVPVSNVDKEVRIGKERTRLDGTGNAVTSSAEALAGLLGGGLLGVGGHWKIVRCCPKLRVDSELTLLGGLLAESLAHGVRHVVVGGWLKVG